MPFIATTTNLKISPETEQLLKQKLGQAIALIPGKTEDWLMLSFQAEMPMYFQGNAAPALYADVRLFGSANPQNYNKMTAELTKIYAEALDILPSRIYVTYAEVSHWGWNGRNF